MDLGKSAAGKQSKPSDFDAAARGATAKHRFITPEPVMSLGGYRKRHNYTLIKVGPAKCDDAPSPVANETGPVTVDGQFAPLID